MKRKFPSIDKPLSKRAFEKYKPLGLFSEFHGNSSEGDADDGGENVDAAYFIDNAVAIVVLLLMSRMKVIG